MSETINTGTPANFEALLEHKPDVYDAFQAFLDGLDSEGMVEGSTFIIARVFPPGDEKLISVNLMHQQGAQPGPDLTIDTRNAGNVGSGGYNPADDSP
jgi:hypothetical protein